MRKALSIRTLIFLWLLTTGVALQAKVSQATADSIARVLNKAPEMCDPSCSLYAQEHTGASLANTIFIALLLILGSAWLYVTYKKKYIIILGTALGALVLGSYFAQPLLRSRVVPPNCPIIQSKGVPAHSPDSFLAPGNEFTKDTVAAKDSVADRPKTGSR